MPEITQVDGKGAAHAFASFSADFYRGEAGKNVLQIHPQPHGLVQLQPVAAGNGDFIAGEGAQHVGLVIGLSVFSIIHKLNRESQRSNVLQVITGGSVIIIQIAEIKARQPIDVHQGHFPAVVFLRIGILEGQAGGIPIDGVGVICQGCPGFPHTALPRPGIDHQKQNGCFTLGKKG